VHDDDVVRLDFVWRGRNVKLAAGDAVAHPGSLREFGGVGVVGVDEFEVGGSARALAEQLELDVTDAASYLKDAGAVESAVDKVGDHPGRGLVQAAFAIPGGEVSSESGPEHVIASTRVAAAAHVSSIRVDGLLCSPASRWQDVTYDVGDIGRFVANCAKPIPVPQPLGFADYRHPYGMEMTPEDLLEAAAASRRALALFITADWSVQAGDLNWDVRATVAHVCDALGWYAAHLAMQSSRRLQFDFRPHPEASNDQLLDVMTAAAATLAAVVRAAPLGARAYHNHGMADTGGFLAMGCNETLIHGWDAVRGLGEEFSPPAELRAGAPQTLPLGTDQ